MIKLIGILICLFSLTSLCAQNEKRPLYPSFDYNVARGHEIKPHRRTIPHSGIDPGFLQLQLTLTVSTTGDVVSALAAGEPKALVFWPEVKNEALSWKFKPFEENGRPVTAQVEEYIDLVPPERLPPTHAFPPPVGPNSKVTIELMRSACFGTCPSYTVRATTEGIVFDGRAFVVASGRHTDAVAAADVRKLASSFVAADFYSMDSSYRAAVTDMPVYALSVDIDGHAKKVEDYAGEWVGMPAVITELEDDIDRFSRSDRWIEGTEGLVGALKSENLDFASTEAQIMLIGAARRGNTDTVKEFLHAGVPLQPFPALKPQVALISDPLEAGWLEAASTHDQTLKVFLDVGASKNDKRDKDLALARAARSGNIQSARMLIAYGADPNFDLSKLALTEGRGRLGSVLIYAAESGKPDMVREILSHHPNLETRDREGKTAIFAAGEYRTLDREGARVECVRLLAQSGANLNARDNDGNTPLHEIFLTDVEEELLKLGADVNARDNDGETPIFTTVDDAAIPLFVKYGADLTIRNNNGQTVLDAAKLHGPQRVKILQEIIQNSTKR